MGIHRSVILQPCCSCRPGIASYCILLLCCKHPGPVPANAIRFKQAWMLSLHVNACVRRVCVHCSVNADRLPAWVLICSRSGWGPKARPYHLSVTEKGITAVLILDHKSHSKIERRRGWWWRRAWQWEKNGRKTVKLWYKRYECDCVCVCCHFCSVLRLPSIHSSTMTHGWRRA